MVLVWSLISNTVIFSFYAIIQWSLIEIHSYTHWFLPELNASLGMDYHFLDHFSICTNYSFENTIHMVRICKAWLIYNGIGSKNTLDSGIVIFPMSIIPQQSFDVKFHRVCLGLKWWIDSGCRLGFCFLELPCRCIPHGAIGEWHILSIIFECWSTKGWVNICMRNVQRLHSAPKWHSIGASFMLRLEANCTYISKM